MGNPASKIAFWRPTARWRNSTQTELRKIERYFVDWIHLAQDSDWWRAVVNRAVNLKDFQKAYVPSPAERLLAS
jgi:hypothetical protein